jgi:hypothetical protein
MHVTLLAVTLLICHQALTLPAPSVKGSELQAYPISSIEVPYEITTPQTLDSRSPSHDKVITDLDTLSLQRRQLPWTSNPLDARVSILVNSATATALQLLNGWLTWHFTLSYNHNSQGFSGTVYSTPELSASDLSVCVNKYTAEAFGNTNGLLWSEGQLDLEASFRSITMSQEVKVLWSGTVRFYQHLPVGRPIASTVLDTVGNTLGYQLPYAADWVCSSAISVGSQTLEILQTVFESCVGG